MIAISLVLSSVIIFLIGVYWYQKKSQYAKLLNSFPPLKPFVPVFGQTLSFSREREKFFYEMREALDASTETTSGWGGIYGSVNIITAEEAEIILSNPSYSTKGTIYELLHTWLGMGIFTSAGAKWHQRRKMLTPAFHFDILQIFVNIFGEQSFKLIESLKKECHKPKIDIVPFITKVTLDTICETAMGVQLEKDEEGRAKYHGAVHKVAENMMNRVLSPWIHSDLVYFFSPVYWHERKLVKLLHSFTRKIIEKRFETFRESDVELLESKEGRPTKRVAMLDLLIYANKRLGTISVEEIREEVDTFVFGGYDTISVSTSYALILISNYQDVQKKIIAELDGIFGDSKRLPTYDDLQNMKYLECCLKESLRLYPSAPFITRRSAENIKLTKHTIPGGTEIFVHIFNIHRDPRYFPDPEKFDPDRFLPENCIGRHPYAYIPFSAGPRNCIGQKFAMMELKSIVSSILRNFTLEPIDKPQDLRFIVDIVLRAKGSMYVKFQPRSEIVDAN